MYEDLYNILCDISNSSGNKAKIEHLKCYKDNELLKKILYYCYEPSLNFGISKNNLEQILKNYSPTRKIDISLFQLLDILSQNNINNELRQLVFDFTYSNDVYASLLLKRILNRNIEIGLAEKGISKVFPNFISTFEVQLAEKFNEKLINNRVMYVTEKLDGIRAIYIDGEFKSRKGKIINGLDHIKDDIEKITPADIVLDGELVFVSKDSIDRDANFRITTKIVNSNMEKKLDIQYKVFDTLTVDEFKRGESYSLYSERRKILNRLDSNINTLQLKNISIVPLLAQTRELDEVYNLLHNIEKTGSEGLMVNFNEPYKCKRHSGILKMKTMQSIDLEIIDVEEGQGENKGVLGNILVNYKDNIVAVGTGFSKHLRKVYWDNPNEIIGKIAEIQYFEESKNQQGKFSLRFPVFKCIREDKSSESYN